MILLLTHSLHPLLRLHCEHNALLSLQGRSAKEIFGFPDESKLGSCATLFAATSPEDSVFHRLLDKYFLGERDPVTLRLLAD